jgi:hypothetical protein
LDYNIDRRAHPRKGFLTKYAARNYIPPPKRRRSPKTSSRIRQLGSSKVLANPKRLHHILN